MNGEATSSSGRTWLFLVIGGAIGLGLGVVVSVTTDVPFAPEIGLVVGVAVGWIARRSTVTGASGRGNGVSWLLRLTSPTARSLRLWPSDDWSDVHAVVVKVTINDREAAEKRLRDETIPRVSQLAGVVAGYWTRSDGPDGLSMVVFESEDAARAAADQVPQMVSESVTLESVEVRQVVANV
jgi:hypothetical protein